MGLANLRTGRAASQSSQQHCSGSLDWRDLLATSAYLHILQVNMKGLSAVKQSIIRSIVERITTKGQYTNCVEITSHTR